MLISLYSTLPGPAFCFATLALMLGAQPPLGRNYGRSMVVSQHGICATSHPLASEAGARILREGGSAADAAIAANAVLGVVEPMMNGIGGDLFVLYREAKTGRLTGLNASGPAPRALSPQALTRIGMTRMPAAGIHSVTVPGAVDGWSKMHSRFGRLPWRRLLEPAIAYAEEGFPVSEIVAALWSVQETLMKLDFNPAAARVFLPREGYPPREGDLFRNPGLALSYSLLAAEGPAAFYAGPIADAILRTSESLFGALTAEDLSTYSAEWVDPISIDYRGWRVYELPPNSQGLAVLEMLNIMEQFPVTAPSVESAAAELHKRIEAMKLAYADAWRYNADPRTASIPLDGLLSKEYARTRAALIDPARANPAAEPGTPPAFPNTSDTVYLAVVDREGNIASWIQSIYASFGSAIVPDGMGFALQNRGAAFSLDPAHPNVLAGGKRPYHTIIPGFMERDRAHVGFGIMGGVNQPLAHAQFISNVADYNMNLQKALEAPRFFRGNPAGCDVSIEARVPAAVLNALAQMGHHITLRPEYSQEMGRGQAVLHNSETGINFAASDPRADGAATPEGIPC